jgi:thiosulfate dehydrogenase [quinone] large subunit
MTSVMERNDERNDVCHSLPAWTVWYYTDKEQANVSSWQCGKERQEMPTLLTSRNTVIQDPPFIHKLLNDTSLAWPWTIIRLYIGWHWLSAGWVKFCDPAWIDTGEALKALWTEAIAGPVRGAPSSPVFWYKQWIAFMLAGEHYLWFSRLVICAEMVVGLTLFIGAFTGFAALLSTFMSWNLLMSGWSGAHPVILVLSISLILAWKVAGYQGADRFLLPLLGTPWSRDVPVTPSSTQLPPWMRPT